MTLKILKEYNPQFDENVMIIKSSMLLEKGTHLFIASNSWDEIVVELHEELKEWCLHYLPSVTANIKVTGDTDYSKYMNILTELFPDKSGAIRRAIMQKTDVSQILGGCII